jgi:hypothetical protein
MKDKDFLVRKTTITKDRDFLFQNSPKIVKNGHFRKTMINERLGFPNLERLLQRKTCSAKSSDSCKSSDSVYLIEKDLNVLAVERLGLMKDLL